MKKFIASILTFFGLSTTGVQVSAANYQLNYDNLILLDAEDLSEQGIKEAYDNLKPFIKKYIEKPGELVEKHDNNIPSYSVVCNEKKYDIYGPELPEGEGQCWGRATYTLFSIVNEQLKNQAVKFYAINGGNDLGGMFLTEEEYHKAINSLDKRRDWPYIPTQEHPWYGQAN